MKITVIGTGFVGVVTSAVFASLGHEVMGLDVDENKIKSLSKGEVPFYEPGLEELLLDQIANSNLHFTTSYQDSITASDIIFIAVGTPSKSDGQADTSYVESALKSLMPFLKENVIIVVKSTVPPGFNKKAREIIESGFDGEFHLASVPEFLKEGTAVDDTLNPDRVIIGSDSNFATEKLIDLHKPLTSNIITMSPQSAQMAKYASNTYLATRITFINQIADLCETNEADIQEVILGMGADKRIGAHYWYPGLGYGGSCFPKDVKEISAYAKSQGKSDSLFIKIDALNESRIYDKLNRFKELVGGWKDKKVTLLGLSFKPETNDIREAPAHKVVEILLSDGAVITASDPRAIDEFKKYNPDITYEEDPYTACREANIVILLIEWKQYLGLDLSKIKSQMSANPYFIDTRNQYERSDLENLGFNYIGVGR